MGEDTNDFLCVLWDNEQCPSGHTTRRGRAGTINPLYSSARTNTGHVGVPTRTYGKDSALEIVCQM